MRQYFYLLYLCILFTSACSTDKNNAVCKDNPEIQKVEIPNYAFISLEDEMMKLTSLEKFQTFSKKHPAFVSAFMKQNNKVPDSILVDIIQKISENKYTDTLLNDTKKHFKELGWLKKEFEQAFQHIKFYYPNFKAPKVYTTFTGLGSFGGDLLVTKDIVVVSLEFFIGEKAKYKLKPEQIPQYIWNRKTKDYILPYTLLFISNQFNNVSDKDKTLLADMVYFGKSMYFVHKMMPCQKKNRVIGFTDQEYANITNKGNQRFIWSHFVEKQLFYSTSNSHKVSYIQEKPYVQEINQDCPGRIGQWLGWRMIEEYSKQKPEISFREIMENGDVRQIFTLSRYKGD